MKPLLLSTGLIFLCFTVGFSQNKQIDSLLLVLKSAQPDTNKVNTLIGLGILYEEEEDFDNVLKSGREALSLSQQLKYKKGTGLAHFHISKYYRKKENYDSAFKNSFISLQLFKEAGYKNGLAIAYRQVAMMYLRFGNTDASLKYLDSAAYFWRELGNKKEEAGNYSTIGSTYAELGDDGSALEALYRALRIQEQLGEKYEIATTLGIIAYVYINNDDDSLAAKYLSEAADIYGELNYKFDLADINIAFGDLYFKQGKYTLALEKYNESLKIYQQPGASRLTIPYCYKSFGNVYKARGDSAGTAGDNISAGIFYKEALKNYSLAIDKYSYSKFVIAVSETYICMGEIYFKLKNLPRAKKYLSDGLAGFRHSDEKNRVANAYLYFSKIDSMEGNMTKAYQHYKLYNLYSEGTLSKEMTKKVEFFKAGVRIEQKEKEIQLLGKENELKTALADKRNQQRKFAYASIGVVLLVSGYVFYRYHRRKKIEMQQTQMKDRLNISRGLHDDMGSTLSSISVYSKVAQIKSDENNKQELNDVLEKISMASSEMVAEMNDTVWAINPGNDNMEKIIQRMESFARPLTAARNIHFSFQYAKEIHSIQLDMEKRKNFYLIFKEAINNAIKYSGASALKVELTQTSNHFELLVKDDGVGFNVEQEMKEPSQSLSGNGLRNMQMRTKEMKGDLQLNSIAGEGTEIRLNFPIP